MPPKRKAQIRQKSTTKRRRKINKQDRDGYISPNDTSEDDSLNQQQKVLKTELEEAQAKIIDSHGADESDDDDSDNLETLEENGEQDQSEEEQGGEVQHEKSKTSKMANAIGRILSGSLGHKDEQRPILAKQKHIERQLDNEKLEAKARKLIAAEKKQKADEGRIIPDHTTTDYEKRLRKVATRGVVKLFNAIRMAQRTAEEIKAEGVQKNKEAVPVLSKTSFLDMLKTQSAQSNDTSTNAPNSKNSSAEQKQDSEGGPSWVKSDFMMKAPKHWDEQDSDEEEY